jgi:hypothetical protein
MRDEAAHEWVIQLVGLGLVDRQANLEAGGSGFGVDIDVAGVLGDNALGGVQSQSEPRARCLGREERFEYAGAQLSRNPRTGIPYLDERERAAEACDEP